ncbi:hypothetical protein ACIQ1D_18820 [Lysinibacillus xylanilyticus]|uniref:hypothetical protein n=1 Tax=Lysinibacillus xylanilyticus TaxID=582475 RepID=UPI003813709B
MGAVVRENEYIYITESSNGYYTANMKGLSVSTMGKDLDKLEEEFTSYVKDLKSSFEK